MQGALAVVRHKKTMTKSVKNIKKWIKLKEH